MKNRTFPVWGSRSFVISALAGALVLSGCASLSEEECHSADWHMIGYEDGAAGREAARLGEHREACSDYGITPDLQAYRRGRDEGLREYCQPRRAYQLGRGGQGYPHVCPPELQEGLQTAYRDGRSIYELASEVSGIERTLQRKQNELRHIQQTQVSNAAEVASPGVSSTRRVQLLANTWELAQRKGAIEDEIAELSDRLEIKREDLNRLQSETRY